VEHVTAIDSTLPNLLIRALYCRPTCGMAIHNRRGIRLVRWAEKYRSEWYLVGYIDFKYPR
jgi:hypothetical protein